MSWQRLEDDNGERLMRKRVHGGWLVVWEDYYAGGMTFVPDPNRKWKERLKKDG